MRRGSTRFFGRAAAAVAADEAVEAEAAVLTRLPDGKILSLSFLGLRQGGGRGGRGAIHAMKFSHLETLSVAEAVIE